MITLAHVNVRTENMEATLAFYEAVLGFRRAIAPTNPDPAQNMWLCDAKGAPSIHVNRVKPGEDPVPQGVLGLHHVAFDCPDRDAMATRLAAAGLPYAESPTRVPGMVQFNLLDPNGVRVELTFGHELAQPVSISG